MYQDLIDEFGWDSEWVARMEANQEMADDAREDIEYLRSLLN